ncbi:MAG TPA: DUF1501 domain-containing protein [Chthonomonadaceae bacterium]|nr:DUF1501 domain-containing protein [Chthonomonadaceae bacterium]
MSAEENKQELLKAITRRHFFQQAGYGIGTLALSALLQESSLAPASAAPSDAGNPLGPKKPHFPAKAKNIIFLFMAGAPSQLDLFDPKPKLNQYNGQSIPEEFVQGERFAFIKGTPKLLGSPHTFQKQGKSGIEISHLLPHLATIIDDVALVRSLHTDQFNHAPAQIYMNTGTQLIGRPSMGSWLTYGLGSVNRDLPGFVVLLSGQNNPDGGKSCWSSGFLPTIYQGVEFRSQGDPILFVSNPEGMSVEVRRQSLDALHDLNQAHLGTVGDPEITTRIASYELAYRMQTSVPELIDISKEPAAIHERYGTEPGKASFANNCLLARRLVERGVRFVQLYHRGWDHHGEAQYDDLLTGLPRLCRETDQAAAALVWDLKQRGLLDSTLVVWGGEFGRTPMNEGRDGSKFLGRDHHPHAFSVWMAGGGVKPGTVVGSTDELGYNAAEDPVHVHDLHATILYLMGLDHTRLTYKFQGRNFRLTDVYGNVVHKLIA